MRYLVTGSAGFVGYHVAKRLLTLGNSVVGVDGMTPYYDQKLKERRHSLLYGMGSFESQNVMLEDAGRLTQIYRQAAPDRVIHLAAQAGVRHSLTHPDAYIDSNIVGTFNLLELCRASPPDHLLIASTSSVYGANDKQPFAETDQADHQLTLYAATKKSAEMMAHCYAHLWQIPTTIFRFFSVYGPWGRPDMALFKFVDGILHARPIDIYNNGIMQRDFTFIDDLVEAICRLVDSHPVAGVKVCDVDSISPIAPFRIVNIGGGTQVNLLDFINEIEMALNRKAKRNYMPMQAGDVPKTTAATGLLQALIGYQPSTPVRVGIREFVDWYLDYYSV